jgi:hypothetical protein
MLKRAAIFIGPEFYIDARPTCWNAPLSSDVCTAKPPAHDGLLLTV